MSTGQAVRCGFLMRWGIRCERPPGHDGRHEAAHLLHEPEPAAPPPAPTDDVAQPVGSWQTMDDPYKRTAPTDDVAPLVRDLTDLMDDDSHEQSDALHDDQCGIPEHRYHSCKTCMQDDGAFYPWPCPSEERRLLLPKVKSALERLAADLAAARAAYDALADGSAWEALAARAERAEAELFSAKVLLEVAAREAAHATSQVTAVRARLDEWETYPEGSEHRVAARWLRAALDVAPPAEEETP